MNKGHTLNWFKNNAINAAKDFGYGNAVIKELKQTDPENHEAITKIMEHARHNKYKNTFSHKNH